MAWLFLFVGVGTGILCVLTSFAVTGAAVICGLSFVAAAIYEVAAVLRQLLDVVSTPEQHSLLAPKKLRQSPSAKSAERLDN